MALFKNAEEVRTTSSSAFDRSFRAGNDAVYEGIYRCANCGMEIAAIGGNPLPGAKQREHPLGCKDISWQLLVATTMPVKARTTRG